MTDVAQTEREPKTGKAEARKDNSPVQRPGKDWPGVIYIGVFLFNSLAVSLIESVWLLLPLLVVQCCLFVGLQELLDLASQRRFARGKLFNEFCGTCVGALLGFNFVAYRQSELSLHANRHAFLRMASCPGRWQLVKGMFLLPWVHLRLVYQVNCADREYVKAMGLHNRRQRCRDSMVVVYCSLALFAFIDPYAVAFCYLLPLVASLWLDTFVGGSGVRLPKAVSLLMLGRNKSHQNDNPELSWYQQILL